MVVGLETESLFFFVMKVEFRMVMKVGFEFLTDFIGFQRGEVVYLVL